MRFSRRTIVIAISSALGLIAAAPALAQFNPGGATISGTVGAQKLSSGSGTVNSGGTITSSGSTVAVTMTGTSTLTNNGTISQTGSGRAIDSNSGTANLTINNAGVISAVSTDAFRVNTDSTVSLTNSGSITVSNGGQAVDWAAITSKSNQLINTATGIISANGDDGVRGGTGSIITNAGTITSVGGDAVRPGANGQVFNTGTIQATPIVTAGAASGSDGVDVRTLSGISVTNSGTITGRHGIATDGSNTGPSTITVTNNSGGMIAGQNGSGINIDGASPSVIANVTNAAGATFKGGVMAGVTAGDGDGIDVDGVLNLTNSGDVLGMGAVGVGDDGDINTAEGVAAGGGTIINNAGARIIGNNVAPNADPTHLANGILIDNSSNGNAPAATTITNSGLIQGTTGFGVKIVSTFNNSVTNNAGGVIRGGALSTSAAVQFIGGNNSLINAGTIRGDNGIAIDMGNGNNTLQIVGGAANVIGSINGGIGVNTMQISPGAGNSFSYGGSISNFSTVQVNSGTVTLSGASTYTGTTQVTGGRLVLAGSNLLASGSSLDMDGGTLEVQGGVNGQTFASFALTGDSTIDLDSGSITFGGLGDIVDGKLLSILDYSADAAPLYAFRLLGDFTANADFLELIADTTINGDRTVYSFDGTYTLVNVPEPSNLLLLGAGLVALLWMRRRRSA